MVAPYRGLNGISFDVTLYFMANTASARKSARQAEKNRLHNMRLRTRLRTCVKNTVKAAAGGDKESAQAAYKKAVPLIDSGVNKNLIHKNKAARHKSRLNRLIRQVQ